MASWGRAHAIKAALVAGFLLILLNLLGSKWDIKTTPISLSHTNSLQWPKRTHLSADKLMMTAATINETHSEPRTVTNATKTVPAVSNLNDFNTISTLNITATSIINSSSIILSALSNKNTNNNNNSNQVIIKLDNITINQNNNLTTSIVEKDDIQKIVNPESHDKSDKNLVVEKMETKTEIGLVNNLMKSFGLNTCPPIPPNLDGPIDVNASFETLVDVEKRLGPKLLPGGWYFPKECNARDRVAIIVPYRDREHHLPIFLKNLHPFLMKQQIGYGVFIVEQTSGGLFNRAALMNIGFVEALKLEKWDCFVFHDVDLLPMDDRNLYTCPDQPRHMSVAVDTFGFKLPYSTIFGGVSAMTVKQFKTVNGFSNSFWGWGGEDDDMSNRLKHVGFHIARYPVNIARYTMLSHKKEKANPKRYEKLVTGSRRFDSDGLNSLKYHLLKVKKNPLYTWIHVEINQDGS